VVELKFVGAREASSLSRSNSTKALLKKVSPKTTGSPAEAAWKFRGHSVKAWLSPFDVINWLSGTFIVMPSNMQLMVAEGNA
jgi:hypothetical protein